MLNYGAPSWFYGEITEFAKQTDVRQLLLGQCRDACILGEGKRLGGEIVGPQYPVWLLRNIDSKLKSRATTNVCLHVPTFCYETQHNQRLYTPSDRV